MTKKSGIYTRGGDKGETSLLGGRRVPKFHPRIEAYGTIDELIAQTAMLRDMIGDEQIKGELLRILDLQMASASILAAECTDCPYSLPEIKEEDIKFLEKRIDEMDASLPRLTYFVIPGGDISVSQAHIVRTVCRRAERIILSISEEIEIENLIVKFYNRLSDYFFVLSRKISAILGIEQKPWNPGL
jgi:cob(I)alamin adenosyltransferase